MPKDFQIHPITSTLSWTNRWDHFMARLGFWRDSRRIEPGLYALGKPTPDSPVLVTGNYRLSFDAVRAALDGTAGYILVLDTQGINVWCAAGKGTFGTDELVHRIEATRLHDAVRHRRLILPQLGASGVAAHEVKKRSGFKVAYGPVRAADLPVFLESGQATPEMRRARFGLRERAILVPVELVHIVLPLTILAAIITLLTSAALSDLGIAVAIGAGVVLFPILLPWLPTRDFSSKGFILGGLIALPFVLDTLLNNPELAWWRQGGAVLALILTMLPATAYVALSFTGSSTFTSRSGVRREIFTYIPIMAAMFVAGLVLSILLSLI